MLNAFQLMIFSTYSGFSRTYPTANQGRSEQESTSALRAQPWWGQLASLSYDFASDPVYSPHRHCKHCSKRFVWNIIFKNCQSQAREYSDWVYKLPLNLMSVDSSPDSNYETWSRFQHRDAFMPLTVLLSFAWNTSSLHAKIIYPSKLISWHLPIEMTILYVSSLCL